MYIQSKNNIKLNINHFIDNIPNIFFDQKNQKDKLVVKKKEIESLITLNSTLLNKKKELRDAYLKEKIFKVIFYFLISYDLLSAIAIINTFIIKNNVIKDIVEKIEFKHLILIKFFVVAILATYIFYELHKHYYGIKNENVTEDEESILKNIESSKKELTALEKELQKIEKNINSIKMILGSDLAKIVENISLCFYEYKSINLIDAITNENNKQEFINKKEIFFLATLDLLEKMNDNDKNTIYSHMHIHPPLGTFYKKNNKIQSLENICIKKHLELLSTISNKILDKFRSSQEDNNCVNYCFSGPPGTGKTQSIYFVIQRIIDSLEDNEEIVLLNITPENIQASSDFQIIHSLIKYYETQGKFIIIFIDEIDSLIKNRSDKGISSVGNQYDIALGMARFIDEINRKKVSILSATNYANNVDGAILRNGRNNHQLFYLPNTEERYELIIDTIHQNLEINSLLSRIKTEYEEYRVEERKRSFGGFQNDNTCGIEQIKDILAALITILSIKCSIAQTISIAKEILEKIINFDQYQDIISANFASSSQDRNYWVDNAQSSKLKLFYDLKIKIQKLLFILLGRDNARDLQQFITEDLFPVVQSWYYLEKEDIEKEGNSTLKSLLALSARQDSDYSEIKASLIKYINSEKLCPHLNSKLLLKYWNGAGFRKYSYEAKSFNERLNLCSAKKIYCNRYPQEETKTMIEGCSKEEISKKEISKVKVECTELDLTILPTKKISS